MRIDIIQKNKDLFDAFFDIVLDLKQHIGNITLHGDLIMGMEAKVDIYYNNSHYTMNPTKKKNAIENCKEYIDYSLFRQPFRSYEIKSIANSGIIFQHEVKNTGYYFLRMNEQNFFMYVVGFGEKGVCASIYKDDVNVAEIHKDAIVYNDMHNFSLHFSDASLAIPVIVQACYMYIYAYYSPGQKVIKGIKKSINITTDKNLISKCKNPFYFT